MSISRRAPTSGRSAYLLSEAHQGHSRRLIIADSHVGTVEGDCEQMEKLLRRAAGSGITEIIYLGDSFQYLIGIEKFWTKSVRGIIEVWDELRASGIRISLIEGNRDFFLDEAALSAHCDSASLEINFRAGSRNFRLIHGDKVNSRDFQYLFWSRISKCACARFSAGLLPARLANAIVRRMEARLATMNRRFRYERPEDDLLKEAEQAFAEGVDVLFWGHFHSAWRHEERNSCACIIPAWLETRNSVLVGGDGSWSLVDEMLNEVAWPSTDA